MDNLDPRAVALTRAIKQAETGNNPDAYNATGASGEHGAYQFMPDTYKAYAQKYLGDANAQPTVENQNKIAYSFVKEQKDAGKNPAQIASMWNAGGGEPDAYKGTFSNGQPSKGTNKEGVAFDVPGYATKVSQAYKQFSGGQVEPNQPTNAPSSTPNTQPSIGDQIIGGAKSVVNFLAPAIGDIYHDIKGDSTKTGLQQLGDVGSTALSAASLIPGLAPVTLAAKAGLIGSKGLGLAGRLGTSAAVGAGFGATNALGAGETDPNKIAGSAVTGGLLGGGLGVAGESAGGLLDKFASKTPTSQLESQVGGLKTLQKSIKDNSTKTTNPIQTFEQRGYTPKLTVDDNGRVNVSAITNEHGTGMLDNELEAESQNASELVKSMQGGVPLQQMKDDVLTMISKNPTIRDAGKIPQAEAEVERRFASYQRSFGDEIPWTSIDNIRAAMNKEYDPNLRDVARSIGDTTRQYLYNGSGTNTALKSAMANEAELIKAKNFAEKLNGTTVKGGRLGKYFAGIPGAMAAGAVGSMGGPIGEGLGVLAGKYAGEKASSLGQKNYFNPLFSKTANKFKGLIGSPTGQAAKNLAKVGLLKQAK